VKTKINLRSLPVLRVARIVRNPTEMRHLVTELRKESYDIDESLERDLIQSLQGWIGRRRPYTEMFYVVRDKSLSTNKDDWGKYTLNRAIAVRVTDEEVQVLENNVMVFKK
jgi:hypothetical protein